MRQPESSIVPENYWMVVIDKIDGGSPTQVAPKTKQIIVNSTNQGGQVWQVAVGVTASGSSFFTLTTF